MDDDPLRLPAEALGWFDLPPAQVFLKAATRVLRQSEHSGCDASYPIRAGGQADQWHHTLNGDIGLGAALREDTGGCRFLAGNMPVAPLLD